MRLRRLVLRLALIVACSSSAPALAAGPGPVTPEQGYDMTPVALLFMVVLGAVLELVLVRRREEGDAQRSRATAWTAEIVWRETGGESRFVVSARSAQSDETVVLGSEPIAWPPRDAEEVAALEQVVSELDDAMHRAGWSELEPGAAWYARRFSWAAQDEIDGAEMVQRGLLAEQEPSAPRRTAAA